MTHSIKDVAYFAFPVTDVPRARTFYEEVLGLKPSLSLEMKPGSWWIEYTIGSATLALSNMLSSSGQSGACLALEVADVDASVATLAAANLKPSYGPMDTPVCRICGFSDPDGNQLIFHKIKAGAQGDTKC